MTATAEKFDEATYKSVTEMSGDEISAEQLQRLCNRYYWAGSYAEGKDTIEIACGAGAGLGYLASVAWSVQGCDISDEVLKNPRAHYGTRIRIDTADAAKLPYADASADVALIFEAIYYLPDVDAFMAEMKRILRKDGVLLIATANKDLYDFNPSPMSHTYFGTVELKALMEKHGFAVEEMAGDTPLKAVSIKQKILRPIKKIVVELGLMPKTTAGKKWMKRLVFGSLVQLPHEITGTTCPKQTPDAITADEPCRTHKVIFCAARKKA
ncbi:MAG: methyltransferase domain-containing protein [Alphaproteobacteria bacterium]|nr:methyltransferase domain-containing protein [Alphaproteobacteria bacterium]